jgi:hypothetical protein
MVKSQHVYRLPMGFIFIAFLNFAVGAILGGVMSVNPSLAHRLAPIHAILNPYGWLTLLIYGMTFAVLALSLAVQLPSTLQGVVQLVVAEAGVVFLVIGNATGTSWPSHAGVVFLVLAPILFLYNILSGVRHTKRLSRLQRETTGSADPQGKTEASKTSNLGAALELFGRIPAYQKTDGVGQRGTDVSLMLFIVAAVWIAIWNWNDASKSGLVYSPGLEWLTFYGWIGGTTLSVALHLAPRFLRRTVGPAWWWSVLQVGWFGGLVLSVIGAWRGGPWDRAGSIVIGLSLVGTAASFLWLTVLYRFARRLGGIAQTSSALQSKDTPSAAHANDGSNFGLHGPGLVAWVVGWLSSLVLGYQLVRHGQPFALSSIHLLFLGFITSLVYAVGYTMFPIILGRASPRRSLAYLQLACAEIGALLLIDSFMRIEAGQAAGPILMSGGVLATLGVLLFLAFWSLQQGNVPKAL